MGFFLFIVIPLVELYLLTRLSGLVGLSGTVALVIGTGILGSRLARSQGLHVWGKIQDQMRSGKLPAAQMVDALMVLVAGVLLVTPGVLTDFVGLSFLLPPIRALARPPLMRWLKSKFKVVVPHGQGYSHNWSGMDSTTGGGESSTSDPQGRGGDTEAYDPFRAKKGGPVQDVEILGEE